MKTKYDWSNVPKWVKFIATDSTGNTYGYEGKIKTVHNFSRYVCWW